MPIARAKHGESLGGKFQQVDRLVEVTIHNHQTDGIALTWPRSRLDRLGDDLHPPVLNLAEVVLQDDQDLIVQRSVFILSRKLQGLMQIIGQTQRESFHDIILMS